MEEEKKKRAQRKMPREESELLSRFAAYLEEREGGTSFPNVAGFCRYCGRGEEWFGEMKRKYPESGDVILTALEDAALNADRSPTLVTAYLKHRLGYGEAAGEARGGMPEVVCVDRCFAQDGE